MDELREKIAQLLEPEAWAKLGLYLNDDYISDPVRIPIEQSLAKADRILAIPKIAEALERRPFEIRNASEIIMAQGRFFRFQDGGWKEVEQEPPNLGPSISTNRRDPV